MTVLIQPMPWLRTAAFSLAVPAGVQYESPDKAGLAALVCEMVQRGAGDFSSRDLVAVQDNLGMDRSSGVSTAMASYGAAMPADSIGNALTLYGQIIRQPHLPDDQLEDARMMMMQELRAVEDEPTQRVMRRLREMHYGSQLGRSNQGTSESLTSLTHDDVKSFYDTNYHADGAILAIAGNVDLDQVMQWAGDAFGDWPGKSTDDQFAADGHSAYEHIEAPSSQTHIGFSFDSIPYGNKDYFRMRAGVGILSDGMSSRLFDRVREQRGLCYTVVASCNSLLGAGGVFGYAGTTPERAQETLDVTLHEIDHLTDDLAESELDRWKVRIESGLIMEQESSASRASSLVSDFYQLGHPLTTAELESMIESLTLKDVRDYWIANPPGNFRLVTLGPEKLHTDKIAS
ncbi:MAG: insulinase family protein [Pirellulaceae bacterium]|nr:insulinase family protein [Pirellulaceae bacterium]